MINFNSNHQLARLSGSHHSQYLFISGNYSSWAHSGYKGSMFQDPNDTAKALSYSDDTNGDVRHFLFQSEAIMDVFNSIGIKKVACGDNHTLFLLNNGQAYGSGWNEYCQLLTRKIAPKSNHRDQLVLADLQQIDDIYCGANFTYCLVRKHDGVLEMYSAGWNNESCCAQGLNRNDTFRNIGRVYYSYDNGKVQDLFPPKNESIIGARCGGSSIAILSFNHEDERFYLNYAGSFSSLPTVSPQGFLQRIELPNNLNFIGISLPNNSIHLHTENATFNAKGFVEPSYENYSLIARQFCINRNGKLLHFPSGRQLSTESIDHLKFKSLTLREKLMATTEDGHVYTVNHDQLCEFDFLPLLSESDRFKFMNNSSSFYDVSVSGGEKIGFILIKQAHDKGRIFKEKLLKQINNHLSDCIILNNYCC